MNTHSAGTFIEQLTPRELDVLNLLAEGMSNQEIASALVMEVGTVKWYNTQLYGKLQVANRKQAVTRARTLGILETLTDDPLQRLQHNLPADTLPFIGRAGEIDALVHQLADEKYRLITILGPGGMGKTRLSIEVGRRMLGHFIDGVYFVPLASVTSPEQIVTTLAETIGFKFHSDTQPRQQLLDHLQKQRLLLIVDNFEHLLDHAGLLADILKAAPQVKLLVTSREKLEIGGEVVYGIGGLSIPFQAGTEIGAHDAVRLFCEAADRSSTPIAADDLAVVARICRMLGGMPLGILLAAAWVDTLALAEIEAEITHGLGILESPRRDAPPRHQSIEAVFDYSWQRLSPDEQAIFMRLSTFREGFTREAAQNVAGASIRDLQRLVHTSFVQYLPTGRYMIHELLRQYGAAKLVASGELACVREDHALYFADLFRPVGEAGWLAVEARTLDAVDPDFENMRAAWYLHLERKDIAQLGQVLDGIWVFLDNFSRSQEAIDLFEEALEVLRGEDDDQARLFQGKLVALLGWFYGDVGQKTRALELTQEALTILQPFSPTDAHLLAHAGRAIFLGMHNELSQAMEEHRAGLELARALDDSRWEGIFCQLNGSACMALGNYQEALRWAELIPEPVRLGFKGIVLNQLGETVQAEACLIQALSLARHHRYYLETVHRELMHNALLRGNHEQAWHYLQRGLHFVDDQAYAWVAFDFLQVALGLFVAEEHYQLAVEVLSLIAHHPGAMEATRAQTASSYEARLQRALAPEQFAAAWERGQYLDLGDLITDLLER